MRAARSAILVGAVVASGALSGCASTPRERFEAAVAGWLADHPTVKVAVDDPALAAIEARHPGVVDRVRALAAALVDAAGAERYRALLGLGALPEAGAVLVRLTAGDDRLAAALTGPGDVAVGRLARDAADGSHPARVGLEAIAAVRVPALIRAAVAFPVEPATDDDRLWEVVSYGRAASPALEALVAAPTPGVGERAAALWLLGWIDPPAAGRAAQGLLARWEDWPAEPRRQPLAAAVADALVGGRTEAALPLLWRLAEHPRRAFRREALRAVAGVASSEAAARVLALCADADVAVAEAAARHGTALDPAAAARAVAPLLRPDAPRGTMLAMVAACEAAPALARGCEPELALLGTSGGADVRGPALSALLAARAGSAAGPLLESLAAADPAVRLAALAAVAAHPQGVPAREAVPAVLPRLADESPEVRAAAVQAAGALGDARAAGPLLELALAARDPALQAAAYDAAARLVERPADGVAGLPPALVCAPVPVWRAVARLGWLWGDDRLGPFFRAELRQAPPDEQAAGVGLLGGGTDPEDLEVLGALHSPSRPAAVRVAAVRALAWRGGAKAGAYLRPLLLDADHAVRAAAAAGLGRVGDAADVAAVAEVVGSSRPAARAAAVRALGRLSGADAAAMIRAALADVAPPVRAAAAGALGRLREGQEARDLDRLLQLGTRDPDSIVVAAAAEAWVRRATPTTRADGWAAPDREEVPAFRRRAAARALAAVGQPAWRDRLAAELARPEGDANPAWRDASEALAAAAALGELDHRPFARRAWLAALALAPDPATAAVALRGVAELAARDADDERLFDALTLRRALAARPLDLPALAAGDDALADRLHEPAVRARARALVRHAATASSLLDQFQGRAEVTLTTGRLLRGELLGWTGEQLALKTAGGRVGLAREQLRAIRFE